MWLGKHHRFVVDRTKQLLLHIALVDRCRSWQMSLVPFHGSFPRVGSRLLSLGYPDGNYDYIDLKPGLLGVETKCNRLPWTETATNSPLNPNLESLAMGSFQIASDGREPSDSSLFCTVPLSK